MAFLQLPKRHRMFLEYFLIARALKQEAHHTATQEQTQKETKQTTFQQQAAAWEQEAAKRFSHLGKR